jgi:hypothetical protein
MRGEGTLRDGVVEFLSRLKICRASDVSRPESADRRSPLGRME